MRVDVTTINSPAIAGWRATTRAYVESSQGFMSVITSRADGNCERFQCPTADIDVGSGPQRPAIISETWNAKSNACSRFKRGSQAVS